MNNRRIEPPMRQQQQQQQRPQQRQHQQQSPQQQHHNRRRSVSPSMIHRNDPRLKNYPVENKPQLYLDEKRLLERLNFNANFDVNRLHLDKKDREIYDENPHLREVFINKQQLVHYDKEFSMESRFLKLEHRRLVTGASSESKSPSSTEHWGQRKLLLTEIEFLTHCGADTKYVVVYAGAAPGSHINYLSSLFPHLQFVLIDTNEFSATETDQIQIKNGAFTNDRAKNLHDLKQDLLFICNVHTFTSHDQVDNDIVNDMSDQMEWYQIMKPHASLLNLRLPRTPGKSEYLDGKLIIEPWASKRSTECRLFVTRDAKLIDYDHQEFENTLLNFHRVKRIQYYKHHMDEVETEGLDHCYDCRAEIFIIQEYLKKVKNVNKEKELKAKTAAMSAEISQNIVDKKRQEILDQIRTLAIIDKKPVVIASIRYNMPRNS